MTIRGKLGGFWLYIIYETSGHLYTILKKISKKLKKVCTMGLINGIDMVKLVRLAAKSLVATLICNCNFNFWRVDAIY